MNEETERKKLERYILSSEKTGNICVCIAIISFLVALAMIGPAASLAALAIGIISVIVGAVSKRSRREYRESIYLLWKDSIDHTPGAETHQCNACFGPVFADAKRCRHCGASFVDEGTTIIPFIGVGF